MWKAKITNIVLEEKQFRVFMLFEFGKETRENGYLFDVNVSQEDIEKFKNEEIARLDQESQALFEREALNTKLEELKRALITSDMNIQ